MCLKKAKGGADILCGISCIVTKNITKDPKNKHINNIEETPQPKLGG